MSKLLKLKEWLTLEEAAEHLSSVVVGEPVSVADILQLSLDGRLRLSIRLTNVTFARKGVARAPENGGWVQMSVEEHQGSALPRVAGYEAALGGRKWLEWAEGVRLVAVGPELPDGRVLDFEGELLHLPASAIFDLPMVGSAERYVERRYQELTGGPTGLHVETSLGFVVIDLDGSTYYQFIEEFDLNPHTPGSAAERASIDRTISAGKLSAGAAEETLAQHAEDRAAFSRTGIEKYGKRFTTAHRLPWSAVLVARVANLRALAESLQEPERVSLPALSRDLPADASAALTGDLKARERTSWRNIVGALVELLVRPAGAYADHTAVVAKLIKRYETNTPEGLSQSNLRKIKEAVDEFASHRRGDSGAD